jgi:hypothetical protein
MNKTTQGIIVALGAAGAYLVYKNWDAILAKFQGNPKGEPSADEPGKSGSDKPESGKEATIYAQKVEILQALLKVAIDGNPGDQTNGTLDFYYDAEPPMIDLASHVAEQRRKRFENLNKVGKGTVSPSNVDFYIQQMQTAQAPRQRFWSASARRAVGEQLRMAWTQSKKRIVTKAPQEVVHTWNADGKIQNQMRTIKQVLNVFEIYKFTGYTGNGDWRMQNPFQPGEFVYLDPEKFKAV